MRIASHRLQDRRTVLGACWRHRAARHLPALARADSACRPGTTDPTKQAITRFRRRVTRAGRPDFVPPAERIATFDNDGTLWVEHPMYTQLAFALDRVKALAPSIRNGRTSSRSRRCWTAT